MGYLAARGKVLGRTGASAQLVWESSYNLNARSRRFRVCGAFCLHFALGMRDNPLHDHLAVFVAYANLAPSTPFIVNGGVPTSEISKAKVAAGGFELEKAWARIRPGR